MTKVAPPQLAGIIVNSRQGRETDDQRDAVRRCEETQDQILAEAHLAHVACDLNLVGQRRVEAKRTIVGRQTREMRGDPRRVAGPHHFD
jgi:hypothetical protein